MRGDLSLADLDREMKKALEKHSTLREELVTASEDERARVQLWLHAVELDIRRYNKELENYLSSHSVPTRSNEERR
jgi:hypothetical protein